MAGKEVNRAMMTPKQKELVRITAAVLLEKKADALARYARWHARWEAGDDSATRYMDRWCQHAAAYDRQLAMLMR